MAAGLGPARCVAAVNLNAESNMQGCAAALQPPNSEARLVGHLDERGSSTGLLRKAWRGAAFRSRAPLRGSYSRPMRQYRGRRMSLPL